MKLDMEVALPRRPFGLHRLPGIGSVVTILEKSTFGTLEHPSLPSCQRTIRPERASIFLAWRPNPQAPSHAGCQGPRCRRIPSRFTSTMSSSLPSEAVRTFRRSNHPALGDDDAYDPERRIR